MALIALTDARLAYGHVALLDGAQLSVEPGERIALIGRNGVGKSSLLKVLAGSERLDDGLLQWVQGLRCVLVPQESDFAAGRSVFDTVADALGPVRSLRERYEAAAPGEDLDALQTQIEALGGWTWEQRVTEALERLGLDGTLDVGTLSGGGRKRVALAQALAAAPDVLLLDEPTNHLDVGAIEWLQQWLLDWRGAPGGASGGTARTALVFISHDRAFIDAVATRIVELDRGILRSYPGRFSDYERVREQELNAEGLERGRADKLLAQEEVWIRKGVEARRTRSVGRVARLEQLRTQRAQRRERVGQVRLEMTQGAPSGKLVCAMEDIGIAFDGRPIIQGLTATVLRGDRVGLIGPNGAGKTTLLKLILGELEPDQGRIQRGTRLQVAYFDQMRGQLDLDATLADTISPGSEWIEVGERRTHVMGYLADFLFAPERARSPVRTLSGGERNRLLLARLFALPANLLVLDEPTNDLDIDTLELLENRLVDWPGTVLLVSHDRRFLDEVVTSTIAYEGPPGRWREYEGGYQDWQRQRARSPSDAPAVLAAATPLAMPSATPSAPSPAPSASPSPAPAPASAAPKQKLSYKESRELEALPGRIEALEAEQKTLAAQLADPEFYRVAGGAAVQAATQRHDAIDEELMQALERWELLAQRA